MKFTISEGKGMFSSAKPGEATAKLRTAERLGLTLTELNAKLRQGARLETETFREELAKVGLRSTGRGGG